MLIVGAIKLAETMMGIHRVVTDEAEMRLSKHATRTGGPRRPHYLRTADTAGRATHVGADPSALRVRQLLFSGARRVRQHQAGELADIEFAFEVS